MNDINIFLPAIFVLFCLRLIFLFPVLIFVINRYKKTFETVIGIRLKPIFQISFFLFAFIAYVMVFNIFTTYWIRAQSTINYKQETSEAKVALVFGFGLEEAENTPPKPGKANIEVHKWIGENIHEKIIIGQLGNILAQQAESSSNKFILMHEHDIDKYINTNQAAIYALSRLDSLLSKGVIDTNVIVIAHDMQLQRAVWILQKLSEIKGKKYNFIVPKMSSIPFSINSTQWHTKSRFIYNCIELLFSRPRDYMVSQHPKIE